MIKFGICGKAQLAPGKLHGFLNKRKFIALDLYHSVDNLPSRERDEIQERMLGRFTLQHGTPKYTHTGRFDDFDQLCFSVIGPSFADADKIRVHDIGVSDGRTSCGIYDYLNGLYGDRLDFLASDYAPYLFVLKRTQGRSRVIVDEHGHLLQIVTPPFVFNLCDPESVLVYPLNYLIRFLVTIFYVRPLLNDYKAGSTEILRERLEILCRECVDRIATYKNFRFGSYDILSGPTEKVNIVRVMNVLNSSIFNQLQLKRALENIFSSLKEGGLFITGSNTERGTVVNGGIYMKRGYGMEKLATSGSGSQLDALIAEMSRQAAAPVQLQEKQPLF